MLTTRLGLCCNFKNEKIKFRKVQATSSAKLDRSELLEKLGDLILENIEALKHSLQFCNNHGIGSFRINSSLLPLMSHRELTYEISDLPQKEEILAGFKMARDYADLYNIRRGFHPGQYTILNTKSVSGLENSVRDLETHGIMCDLTGADTINIHGGSSQPSRMEALERFLDNLSLLSQRVRSRLTVENDDKVFPPEELKNLANFGEIPLVYDVHHHRCRKDKWDIAQATQFAMETWDIEGRENKEPLFHISTPRETWMGKETRSHADYINLADWPPEWDGLQITVEVEAKAKELAVLALKQTLEERQQTKVS